MTELQLIILNVTFNDVLVVLSVIMLSAGVALEFGKPTSGLLFSYLGLWCVWKSGMSAVSTDTLLFWVIAVLLLSVVRWLHGVSQEFPGLCRRFVVGGALAGMAVGLLAGKGGIVAGSIVGAVLGAVAWSRTSSGAKWPGSLFTVFTRVGLPAVVVMSMTGIAVVAFIVAAHIGI